MFYQKKSNLWVAPVTGACLAIVCASITLFLDYRIRWEDPGLPFFKGSSDTARSLLSVIGTSVTTLLALIFTIIVVASQIASSQYSPRTLSTLLQDRPSHITIAIFVGTFTYTLVVLWGLRFTETADGEEVTGISLSLAFVLAIVSLAAFSVYSNHIIHSVRVTSLINRVGEEVREKIESLYHADDRSFTIGSFDEPDREPDHIIYSNIVGVIVEIDMEGLLKKARACDSLLIVHPVAGSFVPEGYPLIRVYGKKPDDILNCVKVLGERTTDRNILYGIRQLTDMAVRANSSGINDPASSVQVLDQLHDLLRRLVHTDLGDLILKDDDGTVRALMKLPSWEDIVRVSLDEIRIYGASSLHVVRRLRATLEDLIQMAPENRQDLLQFQMELLNEAVHENFKNDYLLKLAMTPDVRGTGF